MKMPAYRIVVALVSLLLLAEMPSPTADRSEQRDSGRVAVQKQTEPETAVSVAKEQSTILVATVKDRIDYAQIGLTVLFTGALAVVGVLQFVWLKRTALANRPHVSFTDFQSKDFIGILDEGVGESPHALFSFINLGNSPAFVTEYSVRIKYYDEGTPQEPDYGSPLQVPEGSFAIEPEGRSFPQRRDLEEAPLTPPKVTALRTGKAELLFYGFIRYRDVFRRPHTTRFCLKYDAVHKTFQWGGPKAYNEYT